VSADDLLQDRGAVSELPLVVTDPLDRGQVGLMKRGHDFLDAKSVVAWERLASTHVAQLVQHTLSVLVGSLIALDRLELDLGVVAEPVYDLSVAEAVIARERECIVVAGRRGSVTRQVVTRQVWRGGRGREVSIADGAEDGH
jgi:hypothetical protein